MFEKRLVSWKRNFLSKGGRFALIKGTLSNLPIYYLSIITISAKIAKKLERIQCNFLWRDDGRKRYHLMNWEEVKKSMGQGGFRA